MAEFNQVGRIWQNSIALAELGRIHLSSVSPRHSYCNWASPVTIRQNLVEVTDVIDIIDITVETGRQNIAEL